MQLSCLTKAKPSDESELFSFCPSNKIMVDNLVGAVLIPIPFLYSFSSSVPRRARRGERREARLERAIASGERRGVRRVWWGEKLARQPSDQDQLSSPCPHLYLALSRSFIRQRPTQKKPLE